MARKGGYKIINLKDIEITTNEPVHIDGIYEAIESTNKAILLSGAVVDKIELDDFYILFESSANASFVGVEGDNQITVKDDDTLLWEVYAPSGVTLKEGDGIKIEGDVISADLSGLVTEDQFNSFNTGLSDSLDIRFEAKQNTLVDKINIKTIHNDNTDISLLGEGQLPLYQFYSSTSGQSFTFANTLCETVEKLNITIYNSSILKDGNWYNFAKIEGILNTKEDIESDTIIFTTNNFSNNYISDTYGRFKNDTFIGETYYKENGVNVHCGDLWMHCYNNINYFTCVSSRAIPANTTLYFEIRI